MLYEELKNLTDVEIAQANVRLQEEANNFDRQKNMYIADISERFYEDEQLTQKEIDDLDEAGMPTFTINRMTAIINMLLYFTTSNPPRWKAVGRGRNADDVDMAEIHDKVASYCFDLSKGKALHGLTTENALVRGLGYWNIFVDTDADMGNGEALFGSPDPRFVFVDPSSRDLLFLDAEFIQIAKNVKRSYLKAMFPNKAKLIDEAAGNPIIQYYLDDGGYLAKRGDSDEYVRNAISPIDGQAEDVLPYYETHRLVKVKMAYVVQRVPIDEKKIQQIQAIVQQKVEEMQKEFAVVYNEQAKAMGDAVESGQMIPARREYELEKLEKQNAKNLEDMSSQMFSALQTEKTKVSKYQITAEEFDKLYENQAIKESIVNFHYFYQNQEHICMSCGGETFLESKLYDWNYYTIIPLPYFYRGNPYPIGIAKFMVGKQQEINKAHQIVIHHANLSSNPQTYVQNGAVTDPTEWDSNSTLPGGRLVYNIGYEKPVDKLPQPLNNAFFTLVQEAKSDLPFIAGVNEGAVAGSTERNDEPFRTTAIRDEQSTRGLKKWTNNILEPVLEHVGLVFTQVSQRIYDTHKVIRITNEQDSEEVEINTPKFDYKTGRMIGKFNDYQAAKFDVKIVSGSTFPTNKEMEEAKLVSYKREGILTPGDVLERLEISGRAELMKRHDELQQLNGQMQQMEDEIKKLKGDNDTLERQVVQSRINLKTMVGDFEKKKDVLETEAQQKLLGKQMDLVLKEFKLELGNLLKSIKIENSKKTEKK